MKSIFIFIFVLGGMFFMISCDREMVNAEEEVAMETYEVEMRTTTVDTAIQALVDSKLARLLNESEYNWWTYHYEMLHIGSSSILPPSSNPFLTVPPPDGGNDPEPLVVICHNHDDGSIGCYGIWSIDSCSHSALSSLDCCDLGQGNCEGAGCTCRAL